MSIVKVATRSKILIFSCDNFAACKRKDAGSPLDSDPMEELTSSMGDPAAVAGVLPDHMQQQQQLQQPQQQHTTTPKKPRLVFTDLQRRTLQAIFKVRYV